MASCTAFLGRKLKEQERKSASRIGSITISNTACALILAHQVLRSLHGVSAIGLVIKHTEGARIGQQNGVVLSRWRTTIVHRIGRPTAHPKLDIQDVRRDLKTTQQEKHGLEPLFEYGEELTFQDEIEKEDLPQDVMDESSKIPTCFLTYEPINLALEQFIIQPYTFYTIEGFVKVSVGPEYNVDKQIAKTRKYSYPKGGIKCLLQPLKKCSSKPLKTNTLSALSISPT
jgi:hypothetical protein